MANTSEELANSTVNFLSSPTFQDCLNGNYFGLILCYLLMTLCFFLGTLAHLWCLWFYFYTERKIKGPQVFFLNHNIIEIIYCIKGIEMLNMLIFKNVIFWRVIAFIFGLSWTGRPLLQTCICIEQYLAVVHPVTFLKYKDIKYRIAAAIAVWLMASAYGLYKVYSNNFPDFIYTFVFIIALVVISFCCVSVLCALKHPGPEDTHNTNKARRNRGNQQKRNAFNTIFSALLLILFTYLPQASLIVLTGTGAHWMSFKCSITLFFTSLNSFGVLITPLLKIYKVNHFKRS